MTRGFGPAAIAALVVAIATGASYFWKGCGLSALDAAAEIGAYSLGIGDFLTAQSAAVFWVGCLKDGYKSYTPE